MKTFALAAGTAAWACLHTPAYAQEPEQVEQLEPQKDAWQAQYFGTFGDRDGESRGHAVEAMFGVSDRLALGFEVEAEHGQGGFALEGLGPKLLYRVTRNGAPIGLGVQIQAGLGKGASLKEAEVRLIVEQKNERWWTQWNGMLRRSNEEGLVETRVAYAWSIQRSVAGISWLGVEGSGSSRPLTGATSEHGHFFGPSLTFDIEDASGREIEFGLAALKQIGGDGSRDALRLFIQLGL
jgi:hypothetical protein